jgi:hypothetical protein
MLAEVGDRVVGYDHLLQMVLPHLKAVRLTVGVRRFFAPQRAGEVVVVYQLLRGSVHARVDDAALPAVGVGCGNCPVENFSIAYISDVCLLPSSRLTASADRRGSQLTWSRLLASAP